MAPILSKVFEISPVVLVSSLLVSFSLIWILSYVFDWLQELEYGARNSQSGSILEDPSSLEKVPCPSVFDPPCKYMSLIMPAFNEAARLPVALDETLRYLQWRGNLEKQFTYEIIIVDDGSTDDTVKVAFEYVKKYSLDHVRVIKQRANFGKGAAVRKGMLCARGELLLMLDSDGATKVTDLKKLENKIEEVAVEKAAQRSSTGIISTQTLWSIPIVVFGSRAHLEKQALSTRKWYRNLLMKGFHLCVLLVAGPGVRDTQCGFKMFTRAAARQLFVNVRLKRWCFDVELVYLCKRLHIPIKEVAVNWTEIPGSKLRLRSIVHMLLELVLVRLGYGFGVWKIRRDFVQG